MHFKKVINALSFSIGLAMAGNALAAPTLVNAVTIPGNAVDKSKGTGANENRLGGFFSDLYYDRKQEKYFALPDRGPGGGTIGYDTRVQKFDIKIDERTGGIKSVYLDKTIKLKRQDGVAFNGLRPDLDPLNGNQAVLGRSFDSEGLVVGKNKRFYISDEYGPSVREFNKKGVQLREFTTPDNLLPRNSLSSLDFVNGRSTVNNNGTIVRGRQDNRGFEGVAMTPDGKTLYAVLQDPLVNEGSQNDGRRSRNVRIVGFDVATGLPTKQFIYQLEAIAEINARIPAANAFSATNQGRSIGLSAIIAINQNEFLVLERDNRGIGVDPATLLPIGSKRLFKINIAAATDVSALSLANTDTLPAGVVPVAKSLYFDMAAALTAKGLPIPEKLEGITIGPRLKDGSYALLIGTDNDFSVTQDATTNVQSDVCIDNAGGSVNVPIDTPCPAGKALVPTWLYAIKADALDYVAPDRGDDDDDDDERDDD
ncbi:MAG: esterase-like activity of phytase family protein [Burkholderiales bacterium]